MACGKTIEGSLCAHCRTWHCWICNRVIGRKREKGAICAAAGCVSAGRPACLTCGGVQSIQRMYPSDALKVKERWTWGISEEDMLLRKRDAERSSIPETYRIDVAVADPCQGCGNYRWSEFFADLILKPTQPAGGASISPMSGAAALKRRLVSLARECNSNPGSVLVIGPDDESALTLYANEFGSMASEITIHGARGVFKEKLFGAPVEWGSATYVRR
jgi:hypothetical protein